MLLPVIACAREQVATFDARAELGERSHGLSVAFKDAFDFATSPQPDDVVGRAGENEVLGSIDAEDGPDCLFVATENVHELKVLPYACGPFRISVSLSLEPESPARGTCPSCPRR